MLRTARASRCAHRNTSRGRTRARRSACFATRARSGSDRPGLARARIAETRDPTRSFASEGVEEEIARETGCVISRTVDSGRIREGTLAPPLDGVSQPVDARARASGLCVPAAVILFSPPRRKPRRTDEAAPSRSHFLNFAPGRPVSILSPTREQTSGRPEAHQPHVTSRISRDVPPRPRGRVSGSSHDEYARSRSWTRTRALRNDRA